MDYKVVVTADAEEDLNQYIRYLLLVKKSEQAAKNVLDDFEATIQSLKNVAGSLKPCDNPRLKKLGYRRINFLSHRYFMMYRIVDDIVFVDNIFHELQDYENHTGRSVTVRRGSYVLFFAHFLEKVIKKLLTFCYRNNRKINIIHPDDKK